MSGGDSVAWIAAAKAARNAGRLREAIVSQRRAVALLAGGDADAYAHAARHLADMLCESGATDEAAALYEEVLGHYGSRRTLDAANALRGAAVNAGRRGEEVSARKHWSQARDLYAMLAIEAGVAEATRALTALG